MSANYPRLTCLFIFLWHSSTCALGQTVNQVSSNFQPNQWTNSLVAPSEATFWTSTPANATAQVPQMANPQIRSVQQMRPEQVINPYAMAVETTVPSMAGTAIVGPITQVTLPTVDMTPVRVGQVVVPTAPRQRIAQKASQMRTAMGQLNPFKPQATDRRTNNVFAAPSVVHQAADLAAVMSNTVPSMTTGVAHPPPLRTQYVSGPSGQQQPLQTWGKPITAAATQPNFAGPPVIGTPLRVANTVNTSAQLSDFTGRNAGPFGQEPPIEDLPKPPNQSSPQTLMQAPTPALSLPAVGQAAPMANGCSGGQCQVSQGPRSTVYSNPTQLQNHPLPVCSNQLLVHPNQLTQQISQRDLQAFIANSVNAYCAPQQQLLPRRQPALGTICGCHSPGTSRLWSRWESLIYWLKGYDVPALVTSSPAGTPVPDVGVPGLPTTATVFGDSSIGESLRTGGRLKLGFWADSDRCLGVEGEFFALGSANGDDFGSTLGGNRIVARPFFNTDPAVNAQAAGIVNMPRLVNGFVDIDTSSRIYSGAAAVRYNFKCRSSKPNVQSRFDLLAGYRYFHLGETLGIYELTETAGGVAGSTNEFYDEYRTRNDLHGVEFGFNWMRQHNRHYLELLGTVALGEVTRTVDINGFSNAFVPGVADDIFPGGFYAHPSQQGRTVDREFAVLPQARAKWGYYITPALRVFVGYDFLYLSSVVRPSSQIDQSVDPADLLTAGRQPRRLRTNLPDDEAWLQGASFGLLYNF